MRQGMGSTKSEEPDDLPANTPTDYLSGYEKARAIDPEMASNYIAHTLIGDPLGEEAADDLAALDQREASRLIELAMNDPGGGSLCAAPSSLRELFKDAEAQPHWLDLDGLGPGIRMFHRNSYTVLVAFVAGVLIEGFMTNIAKSFMLTGRIRDRGVRRLGQNNRHMTEIFFPGGLLREGDGWKLSVRIRIVHAQLRRLISNSGEWDAEAWGTPISAAHLGFSISGFSARLLKHMKTLGASYNEEESRSFMNVWRYSGYLMGIPETILFRDESEALKLYDVGLACEPDPGTESVAMTHSLINSAPLIAGVANPEERRHMTRYVYRVSRGLIGKQTADSLKYPEVPVFGVVWWFRMQTRLDRILGKLIPGHRQRSSFNRFGYLLAGSTFDERGISYRLPDNVYAEESKEW